MASRTMLTRDQVKHVAALARLKLDDQELGKYQQELGAILNYIDQLKRAKVEGIEPTSQVTGSINISRADDPVSPPARLADTSVVSQAPERVDNWIKVPAVFD